MKRRHSFEDGYHQLERGRVDAAREIFESLPVTDYRASFGLLMCDYNTAEETPQVYARRCELAEAVLANVTEERDRFRDLAVRYAANHLAYGTMIRATGTRDLEQALAYSQIGLACDPQLDASVAPVTATHIEVLMALERFDEAFELCHRVLEQEPGYPHLANITSTDRYTAWANQRAAQAEPDLEAVFDAAGIEPMWHHRRLLAFARDNNSNPAPNPLSRDELDGLRMWRWRDGGDAVVPLPPSLRLLLAYDRDLSLDVVPATGRRFFAAVFDHRDAAGAIASPTMTKVCAEDGQIGSGFAPHGDMYWVDGPEMPGLLEVPLGADQRVFLYMGEPDEDGEYPIVRFDNQPELWLTSATLADELVANLPGADQRAAAARRRNERWLEREWLAP